MTYTTTRYGSRFVRFRSTLARESRARASMAPLDDAFDVEFIDDAVDEAVRDASRARAAAERAREARGRARVSQTSRGGEDVRSSRGGETRGGGESAREREDDARERGGG